MQNTIAISKAVRFRVESLKIGLGVLVLFAGSQIAIPLEPVPITMQTVAVMLIGLLYTRGSGLATIISYLALGGIGLPMFQGFEGGFSHLYGPTAGYLFGFVVSIYFMTVLREKFGLESFWGVFANCLVGTLIVFACGVPWLAMIIGFKDAVTFGVVPFIIPGAIKAIILSGAFSYVCGKKA